MAQTSTRVVGQKIATKKARSRPPHDFYATPVEDIERMLKTVFSVAVDDSRVVASVLDPCAGNSAFRIAINEVLPHWSVFEADIVERETPLHAVGDFLQADNELGVFDIVMMNPPYNQSMEFIQHAMKFLKPNGVVVAFLKLDFLATKKRYEGLYKDCRLTDVYVNVGRVHCKYNGDLNDKENSTTESGWFIFRNTDEVCVPRLHWLEK